MASILASQGARALHFSKELCPITKFDVSSSLSSVVSFRALWPLRRRCRIQRSAALVIAYSAARLAASDFETSVDPTSTASVELLACPICFDPLTRKGPRGLNQLAVSRSGFQCERCKKVYSSRDVYVDLTTTSSARVYQERQGPGTELFRSPLVSFVYERGWRQNFRQAGFPGPDEEVRSECDLSHRLEKFGDNFARECSIPTSVNYCQLVRCNYLMQLKMAQKFFKSSEGSVLVDVSCGSGLFTRRFAKSGAYTAVVGLDFSENMLRQSYEFMKEDRILPKELIALVRADVARLPFATGTIGAVHAGAAIHCWPSPAAGVAEISRILAPGGVFVATTFTLPTLAGADIFQPLYQALRQISPPGSNLRYWREDELEDIVTSCGLINYQRIRISNFVMLAAQKPADIHFRAFPQSKTRL